jgi:hypothetical protein
MTVPGHEDRYLAPGTKVRLDSLVNNNEEVTSEYGVVVHCWKDEAVGFFDCYVAFFGDAIPSGQPSEKPYVLRYAAITLVPIA